MAAWDKLEAESAKAYAAFRTYMLLPARERSIQTAYRASSEYQSSTEKRASGRWSQWAAQHDWIARAAEHDTHLAKQDELLWEERRRRKKEREWDQTEAIRDIVQDAIPHARQFVRRKTAFVKGENGQPDREIITMEFDIVGLTTVVEKIGKVQNLILGNSTDNVDHDGEIVIRVEYGDKRTGSIPATTASETD